MSTNALDDDPRRLATAAPFAKAVVGGLRPTSSLEFPRFDGHALKLYHHNIAPAIL